MALYRPDGQLMGDEDWENPSARALAIALDGRQISDAEGESSDDRFVLIVNAHHEPVEFVLPSTHARWATLLASAEEQSEPSPDGRAQVEAHSFVLLHSSANTSAGGSDQG